MNYLLLLLLLTFFGQYYLNAADVRCARAIDANVLALVKLINTQAYKAEKQIVVLPEKYREGSIKNDVAKQRIFVVQDKDQPIGFKKLFLVEDPQECDDILRNEIRCIKGTLLAQAAINLKDGSQEEISDEVMDDIYSGSTTYIYNGGDFTCENYRSKGINTQLTQFALNQLADDVIIHAEQHESNYIAMLFGLTDDNAVDPNNLLAGRSKGIIESFKIFAGYVAQKGHYEQPSQMLASRYLAYKPSFDQQGQACVPLPDDQAVKGCGCVLAFKLRNGQTTC